MGERVHERDGRRAFLTVAGAGAVLAACRKDSQAEAQPTKAGTSGKLRTRTRRPTT